MNEITTNPNRIDLDEAYMQMAEIWAKRSKANRLQVGALIVKDRQVISDGYNGMPAGAKDDTCEFFTNGVNDEQGLTTKREVLHAESNALMKISENGGVGAQGATIYTTWSPCFECSKLIRQAKVKRVVFRNLYRDSSGVDFLRSMGVQVDQLAADAFQGTGQVELPPAPPVVRQTVKASPDPEVARLQMLRAIAGVPAKPAQVAQAVSEVVAEPIIEPPLMSSPAFDGEAVAAALAAAGISLEDGVPVERPAQSAGKKPPSEDTGYTSSFA